MRRQSRITRPPRRPEDGWTLVVQPLSRRRNKVCRKLCCSWLAFCRWDVSGHACKAGGIQRAGCVRLPPGVGAWSRHWALASLRSSRMLNVVSCTGCGAGVCSAAVRQRAAADRVRGGDPAAQAAATAPAAGLNAQRSGTGCVRMPPGRRAAGLQTHTAQPNVCWSELCRLHHVFCCK